MNPRNLTLFLIAILINSLNVFGQGPTSHWYFGYGTGIRFQNGLYILTLESNNLRSVDRIIVQHD